MTVKTFGVEFKRFYSDQKYWPDKGDTYHDDVIYRVNGEEVDGDFDMTKVEDTASIEIEGGIVMNSPFYSKDNEPSLETYFRRWKKEQTTAYFLVECDVSQVEGAKKAVKDYLASLKSKSKAK